MATVGRDLRATELAEKAVSLITIGKVEVRVLTSHHDSSYHSESLTVVRQEASRALREALSLAPNNVEVKAALFTVQRHEATQPLLEQCLAFSQGNDVTAGKEVLWFLSSRNAAYVAADVMIQCFDRIISAENTDAAVRDDLVASLLHHSVAVRTHLAKKLQGSISVVFEQIFHIGDGAANGITIVSLDTAAWASEEERLSAEQDVFLLFLAKFLESGHDYDGRALKGISRHLAADAKKLHTFVDEESFDAILYCLDYRVPKDVRGQATIATAKYLEAAKEVGEEHLTKFIRSRTAKHSTEDLVKAFSVAATVFPIATPVISALFLTEGFLVSLVPMLDKKSRPIKVEKAALDMLSAACIDKGCREAISKYCLEWMHHVMDDEEDERHGQAALILAKVQGVTSGITNGNKAASNETDSGPGSDSDSGSSRRSSKGIADVVPTLRKMLIKGGEMDTRTAIEGLAYASMQPSAKDEIIRDTALLQEVLQLPGKDSLTPTTAFGYLTLISNLCRYRRTLSEEQKRISELKAYANASRPAIKPHPLDEDSQVTARCMRLIDSKVVPYLVALKSSFTTSSSLSPSSLSLCAQILLALSRNPTSRGVLAQQGAVQLLLQLHRLPVLDINTKPVVSHVIARILISIDPALLPSSYIASSISPLISLLTPAETTDNSPRDFLPTFEALLALTNLASNPSLSASPTIVRGALSTIEDLLLSSNHALQRAATELICNLVASPEGVEKFADGSPAAGKRLHILLALTDAEDVATRRAAGGALAGITEFDGAVKQILDRERGFELLVRMCQDEEKDQGVIHRGVVCLRNVVCLDDSETGSLARRRVNGLDGLEVLKGVIRGTKDSGVLETAVEAIKRLNG